MTSERVTSTKVALTKKPITVGNAFSEKYFGARCNVRMQTIGDDEMQVRTKK